MVHSSAPAADQLTFKSQISNSRFPISAFSLQPSAFSFPLSAFCFLLSAFTLFPATIQVNLADFQLQSPTNRRVVVSATPFSRAYATNLILRDPIAYTATNGQFYISNAIPAEYKLRVLAPPAETTLYLLVPDTNALLNAADLWVRDPADLPSNHDLVAIAAGDNVSITTNRFLYTISATAAGTNAGPSGALTNNETRAVTLMGSLTVTGATLTVTGASSFITINNNVLFTGDRVGFKVNHHNNSETALHLTNPAPVLAAKNAGAWLMLSNGLVLYDNGFITNATIKLSAANGTVLAAGTMHAGAGLVVTNNDTTTTISFSNYASPPGQLTLTPAGFTFNRPLFAGDVTVTSLDSVGVVAQAFVGDGARLTNTMPFALQSAYALGPSDHWYWWASIGSHTAHGERMKLYVSRDGLSWAAATTNAYDYRDPDEYTNNANGPIATEFSVQYAAGAFWGVYNYDPYNTNGNAQALALARSVDGTNWSRYALLYLQGKTNLGAMFAATWFSDQLTNYLVYAYRTGVFNLYKDIYITPRLDDTFTNWGPSVKILGSDVARWDGWMMRTGNRYDLYYVQTSGEIGIATNNTLGSVFTHWKTLPIFDGEAPAAFRLPDGRMRVYYRSMSIGQFYIESRDNGESWSDEIQLTDDAYWHGPGIMPPARVIDGSSLLAGSVRTNALGPDVLELLGSGGGVSIEEVSNVVQTIIAGSVVTNPYQSALYASNIVGQAISLGTNATTRWMVNRQGTNLIVIDQLSGMDPVMFCGDGTIIAGKFSGDGSTLSKVPAWVLTNHWNANANGNILITNPASASSNFVVIGTRGIGLTNGGNIVSLRTNGIVVSSGGISSLRSNLSSVISLTVTTNVWNWTNTFDCNVVVYVTGGTGTGEGINGFYIRAIRNTATTTYHLQPSEWITITNSVAPSVMVKPF